jgi:Tol biopolymer transport system component
MIVALALVLLGGTVVIPAGATFPARNGRIAFSTDARGEAGFPGGSQIYTVRPDGSGIRQLTHVAADRNAVGPDWSPDGSRILYQSDVTGNWEIWVMDANGSNQIQLTNETGYDHRDPRWSPDGSHIAFVRCSLRLFGTSCPIFKMRADGTHMKKLLGGNWVYAHLDYSPNGRKITFDSNRGGFLSAVWVVKADGTKPRRLTPVPLEADFPSWSPNGSHIVFTDFCCKPRSNLWKVRANGTHLKRLTHIPPGTGRQVGLGSYSPNGKRILFLDNLHRLGTAKNDLYTMRLDGTGVRPVVISHPYLFSSDWGPRPES